MFSGGIEKRPVVIDGTYIEPVSNYMLNVNSRNTRKRCEVNNKDTRVTRLSKNIGQGGKIE